MIFYGPPKLYGIVSCQIDTVDFGFTHSNAIVMKRETAGLMVVILDWLIMLVMTVGIIRLRWYE